MAVKVAPLKVFPPVIYPQPAKTNYPPIPDKLIHDSFMMQHLPLSPIQVVKMRPWVKLAMQTIQQRPFDAKAMRIYSIVIAFHAVGKTASREEEVLHHVRTAIRSIVQFQRNKPLLNKWLSFLQQLKQKHFVS